jgi:hypothetical protein
MAKESNFKKLSNKVKKSEMKAGYDEKKAAKIADATAYTIGKAKYGKKGMAKKAAAGRARKK